MHRCSNIIGLLQFGIFHENNKANNNHVHGKHAGLVCSIDFGSYFRYHRARYLSLLCVHTTIVSLSIVVYWLIHTLIPHTQRCNKLLTMEMSYQVMLSFSPVPVRVKLCITVFLFGWVSQCVEKTYFAKTRKKCWLNNHRSN